MMGKTYTMIAEPGVIGGDAPLHFPTLTATATGKLAIDEIKPHERQTEPAPSPEPRRDDER